MHIIFVLGALGLGLASLFFVTQATFGVWMVGAACLCGILARIVQSDRQVRDLLKKPDQG